MQEAEECHQAAHIDLLWFFGYQVLGTPIQAIVDTEDRARFSQRLDEINEHAARSASATTVDQAVQIVCACA